MDNSDPWYMQVGDTLGLPGVAGAGATSAKVIKSLLPYVRGAGLRAVGSLAGGPFTAALTGAQVMNPTDLNSGEKPYYIRDPATGQMVPNPQNKFDPASIGNSPPMSPFPASYPYPGIPNGMNPANPSVLSMPAPTPAPMAQPSPAAPFTPQNNAPQAPSAPAYANGGSLARPMSAPQQAPQNNAPQQGAPSLNAGADFATSLMPTTQGGGSLLGKLIDLPSKIGGQLGLSQIGPTFANGSAGMMGGVPFSIF